jgi:hypothetical protein
LLIVDGWNWNVPTKKLLQYQTVTQRNTTIKKITFTTHMPVAVGPVEATTAPSTQTSNNCTKRKKCLSIICSTKDQVTT